MDADNFISAAGAITEAVLSGDATRVARVSTPPWVAALLQSSIDAEGLSCARMAVRLLRTHDRLTRGIDAVLKRHGLSLPRFEVLMQLWFSPTRRMTLCDLSAHLLVPPSNLTGLIDRLERSRLVVRVPDTADRRLVFAQITPEGEELLARVLPEHLAALTRMFHGLSPQERAQLSHLLERADQVLTKEGAMDGCAGAACEGAPVNEGE
jgi:MarR family 2-MHQ and catechol resistance regulon transcriptional repressor